MATWKLIVENYGKIKSAEIEMAPLTLFVGDNNTGKSYLLALLWGIEKFGVKALLGEHCANTDEANVLVNWICDQIDMAKEKQSVDISLKEVSDELQSFINLRLKKQKSSLVRRIFNSKNVEIGKLSIELGNIEDLVLHIEANEESPFVNLNINKERRIGIGQSLVTNRMHRNAEGLRSFLVQGIYSCIMDIGIGEDESDACVY